MVALSDFLMKKSAYFVDDICNLTRLTTVEYNLSVGLSDEEDAIRIS